VSERDDTPQAESESTSGPEIGLEEHGGAEPEAEIPDDDDSDDPEVDAAEEDDSAENGTARAETPEDDSAEDDTAEDDSAEGDQFGAGPVDDMTPDGDLAEDDALLSRLRLIEERPLEARAGAFAQVHDELQSRLEGADSARSHG
jgi:hypothetical protein